MSRRAASTALLLGLVACGQGASVPELLASPQNVLFIGNSLTAANDLPGMVEGLGRMAGLDLRCAAVARPGFSLEDHWNDGEARRAVARGGWSHVVLQQGPSALPESRVLLNEYARRFGGDIRRVQARPALFMVWPSADRSGDFDGVSRSYAGAAALIDGLLFRAGDAWRAGWRRDAGLGLYGPDGFHPSRLGSFLAAMVIVHRLGGRLPEAASLPGVSNAEWTVLVAAAREAAAGVSP